MQISRDSWHFRLYVFMSQWNAAWQGKSDYLDHPKMGRSANIGLCPYMRMILIWGPLSILSNLVPIAAVIVAIVLFPAGMNGLAGVGWLVFWAVTLVGSGLALGKLADWREARYEQNRKSQLLRQDPDYVEPDSFWKLVKEFAVATKTKICPVLEVKQ